MRKNVVVFIIYDVVIEDTDLQEQMKVEESITNNASFSHFSRLHNFILI